MEIAFTAVISYIFGWIFGAKRRKKIEAAYTGPDRRKSADAEHGLRWRE